MQGSQTCRRATGWAKVNLTRLYRLGMQRRTLHLKLQGLNKQYFWSWLVFTLTLYITLKIKVKLKNIKVYTKLEWQRELKTPRFAAAAACRSFLTGLAWESSSTSVHVWWLRPRFCNLMHMDGLKLLCRPSLASVGLFIGAEHWLPESEGRTGNNVFTAK